MLPTRRGAVLLLAALLIYLVAYYSHVGWYYVADAVAWALLLVNLALPRWSLRGLSVARSLTPLDRPRRQGVFQGDRVRVTLELRNEGVMPRLFLRLVESCPLAAPEERVRRYLVGMLGGRSGVSLSYDARCHQRGEYSFAPVEVESTLPFGLFRARRRLPAPLGILVYPEVFAYRPAHLSAGDSEAAAQGAAVGVAGEFRGAREYQPGDVLRNIHWRRSARESRLMVKEYDPSLGSQVTVLFNGARSYGAGRETTLEYAIKLAASIAKAAFVRGDPFRLLSPDLEATLADWQRALAYLARFVPVESSPTARTRLLDRVPGRVIALLSTADPDGPGLLGRIAPGRLAGLVALQGFAPELETAGVVEQARRQGATVVTCAPGGVAEALDRLGVAQRPLASALAPGRAL